MNKKSVKIMSAALVMSTLLSISAVNTGAAVSTTSLAPMSSEIDAVGREHKSLKGILSKNLWAYSRPSVTVGNKTLTVQGVIINGVSYIPFRQAASAISGSTYSYDSKTKTATMKAPGLEITAGDGCYVTYANGRVLFSTTPNVIMSDGRMYIPASVFAKAVGMTLRETANTISISGSYNPILSGDKFYSSDEVFWLARIIHAESRGEALIVQIAVGNVIMNRVESPSFPNTIWGVIFDRKYGVQFSPIANGTIYEAPSYTSVLAAKICLEGFSVSEDILYFLAPRYATSSWISNNRPYVFTVKNHEFYA